MSKEKPGPNPFQVGQEVLLSFTNRKRKEPEEYVVKSIGRVWVEVQPKDGPLMDRYFVRASNPNPDPDGGYAFWYNKCSDFSAGICYPDPTAERARRERIAEWQRLKLDMQPNLSFHATVPEGVTVEKIRQAREILGLAKGEDQRS